jgi:hypothetical protein
VIGSRKARRHRLRFSEPSNKEFEGSDEKIERALRFISLSFLENGDSLFINFSMLVVHRCRFCIPEGTLPGATQIRRDDPFES